MGAVILALLGLWLVLALRSWRRGGNGCSGCNGDCGNCRGCDPPRHRP